MQLGSPPTHVLFLAQGHMGELWFCPQVSAPGARGKCVPDPVFLPLPASRHQIYSPAPPLMLGSLQLPPNQQRHNFCGNHVFIYSGRTSAFVLGESNSNGLPHLLKDVSQELAFRQGNHRTFLQAWGRGQCGLLVLTPKRPKELQFPESHEA